VQKQIKFFGFISGVKPKVSKILKRHLSGESDGKEDVEDPLCGTWSHNGGGIMNRGASPRDSNTQEQHEAHENQLSPCSSGTQGQRAEGYGSPGPRLFDDGFLRPATKWIQARQGRESLYHLSPPDSQTGGVFENPRDTEGRDCKGSSRRVCGLTKECPVLDESEGDWEDESWPVTSSGWSWGELELGSHQD
jgi:hypothetical protein